MNQKMMNLHFTMEIIFYLEDKLLNITLFYRRLLDNFSGKYQKNINYQYNEFLQFQEFGLKPNFGED